MPEIINQFHDPRMLHCNSVADVLFLSDGRLLSRDGKEVILWDLDSGLARTRFELEAMGDFRSRLSLTAVENELLCYPGSAGQPVQVLRISGDKLEEIFRRELPEDENYAYSMAWTGAQLVIGAQEYLEVVDAQTQEVVRRVKAPVKHDSANAVAVSQDGNWAAWADTAAEHVRLLNVRTGEPAGKIKPKQLLHRMEPYMVLAGDGQHLEFAWFKNGKTALERFTFDEQADRSKTKTSFSGTMVRHTTSPDLRYTVLEKVRSALLLHDWETGEDQQLVAVDDMDIAVAFSPGNLYWARTWGMRVVRVIWSSGEVVPAFDGPTGPLGDLAFMHATGQLIARRGGTLAEIDRETGAVKQTFAVPYSLGNMQGRYVVSRQKGHYVRLDLATGVMQRISEQEFPYFEISDQNYLSADYTNRDDSHLQVWTFDGRPGLRFCHYDTDTFPRELTLFADGSQVAFIREDKLQVWSTAHGKLLRETDPAQKEWFKRGRLYLSPDQQWLLVRSRRQPFRMLDPAALAVVWEREFEGYVQEVEYTPDGKSMVLCTGQFLSIVDVATGEDRCRMDLGLNISSLCAGPDARLYVSLGDTALVVVDAGDVLEAVRDDGNAEQEIGDEGQDIFCEWPEVVEEPADFVRKLLAEGKWSDFDPERDLLRLRELLQKMEKEAGLTDLHQQVSAQLLPRYGMLLHRFGHQTPIIASGMSPDGRWLATGSWVGEDYEEGGQVMVWEVATGRCVNILRGVSGGVGWPDYPGCIQWSPDGSRLGIAFNTNSVGSFLPFSTDRYPLAEICVTNGWSRPPAWCWAPDSARIMVACWGGESPVPGCIAPLDQGDLYEDDVTWFADAIPQELIPDDEEDLELQPFKEVHWSRDGSLIYGHNSHDQAFGIDAGTGAMRWYSDVGQPIAWDPDDQHFAHNLAGLLFYETQTGLPTFKLPMIVGATTAHWSPVPGQQRLAVVVTEGNPFEADAAVHIYHDRDLLCSLDSEPDQASYGDLADGNGWAWSPDGHYGAVLSGGKVEIWKIAAEPELLTSLEVHERVTGILWGADSTIVALGTDVLEFFSIVTGELRSQVDLQSPEGLPVPPLSMAPLAEVDPTYPDGFAVQPCAPVLVEGEYTWLTAYAEGRIVAPESLAARLDEELCYSVAGRYAWPLRWTSPEVATDLATASGEWGLGYDADALAASMEAPNREDFFRLCRFDTPEKPWSKKDMKDYQGSSKLEEYWLPSQKVSAYHAPEALKGDAINADNLRNLLGKCVLYAEDYDPNRPQIGALVEVDEDSVSIIFHDSSSMSGSGSSFEDLVFIGEAQPRI